jgi:hypothetical protein
MSEPPFTPSYLVPLRITSSPWTIPLYLLVAGLALPLLLLLALASNRDGSLDLGSVPFGSGWTAGLVAGGVMWMVWFGCMTLLAPRWIELRERCRCRLLLQERVRDWSAIRPVSFGTEKAGRWLIITPAHGQLWTLPVTPAEEAAAQDVDGLPLRHEPELAGAEADHGDGEVRPAEASGIHATFPRPRVRPSSGRCDQLPEDNCRMGPGPLDTRINGAALPPALEQAVDVRVAEVPTLDAHPQARGGASAPAGR